VHEPKFAIKSEEILSRAHGNFEEQNKVLESYTIITNYCIFMIINAYYKYTINAHYNYDIVNPLNAELNPSYHFLTY